MKHNVQLLRTGFTLIELLVVISIIVIITTIGVANFVSARSRTRDIKTKEEFSQLKAALRLYYNDNNTYPPTYPVGKIQACPTKTNSVCTDAFTDTTVYMKLLPKKNDGSGNPSYLYNVSGTGEDFCLSTASQLEFTGDPEILQSQTRCASACGANCTIGTVGKYCVCAD